MLTVSQPQWFSWDATISDGARQVGGVTFARWREAGSITVGAETFAVARERRFSGEYLLTSGGTTIARAGRPTFFGRHFEMRHDGDRYTLQRRSWFGREYVLKRGDHVLGSVARPAIAAFRRQAQADLPSSLPLPVQLFVVWLVLLAWRQAARAAA